MARTYKRDSNGRFAGGGGNSKSRPATKQLQRGTNRLTRDNAGRITSVGGSGATAYGGRIRTAAGNRRATTVAKGIGKAPKGTVGKSRGLKPRATNPQTAVPTIKESSRRRRPTATESRANGLMPISDIRARQAAQVTARDANRTRRMQSNMTRDRGQQVASTQGKQRAPFGRYSTIKNPAAEGSFPQMAPGRTGQGMAQAAKGRTATKPPMTKAEYEAAAQKAWGRVFTAHTPKAKQSADQQLDRLSQRSGNLTRSGYGLSKDEAIRAQELAKKTNRSVRVSQNPSGGYSIKASRAANRVEMAKGRNTVLTQQKNALNKQLKEINAKIKAAGPSAAAFRLQKLQIQDKLAETRLALAQSQRISKGNA